MSEAIESILNQTFMDYEFLIIDDGSSDSTADILNSYKKRDRRIRIIKNPSNLGLTKSLNIGLAQARGELIAHMDADDISLPRRLEVQHEYMQENPQPGLISTWFAVIDSNGEILRKVCRPMNSEDIFYQLFFLNPVCHSSVMYRKKKVKASGGYNEAVYTAQDYELWGRLVRKARFYNISEILVQKRESKLNISSIMQVKQIKTAQDLAISRIEGLTRVELSLKSLRFLQSPHKHNIDFNSFRVNMKILEILNRMILLKEKDVLEKTGLSVSMLKRAMTSKLRELLYIYMREESDQLFRDFCRLKTSWKYHVMVETAHHIVGKLNDLRNRRNLV